MAGPAPPVTTQTFPATLMRLLVTLWKRIRLPVAPSIVTPPIVVVFHSLCQAVSHGETLPNTLERGLEALELLGETGGVRLAELAQRLKVSRATAFRLLTTLQVRGYVTHDRASHVYKLSEGLEGIVLRPHIASLLPEAVPVMEELREATGETICLAAVRGHRLLYASILPGRHSLGIRETVATPAPWHSTALGKAILAHLPESDVADFVGPEPFQAFTHQTRRTMADLQEELEATRGRGYAVDDQETEVGALCFAAPIFGVPGHPDAAISVSCLSARIGDGDRPVIGKYVAEACERISRRRPATAPISVGQSPSSSGGGTGTRSRPG